MKNNYCLFFLNIIVAFIFLGTVSFQPLQKNTATEQVQLSTTASLYEDLCVQLKEIMAHAHTNFEKIATDEEQPHEDQREGPDVMKLFSLGVKASLKFPGARQSSVVAGFVGPDNYEAYFGSYKTLSEAEKKLDSLKNQMILCLKNYKMKKEGAKHDDDSHKVNYEFDEKRTDKTAPQHIRLSVQEDLDWGDDDSPKVFKVYLYIYGLRK